MSQRVTRAIKNDGFLNSKNVIDSAVTRIAGHFGKYEFLKDCFSGAAWLIPMPRSSPQKVKDSLWPAMRICASLLKENIGVRIVPCLKRTKAVPKASTAGPGQRPTPTSHFRSIELDVTLFNRDPAYVTVVDDVITMGSSFIGVLPHLHSAFPKAKIRCFAVVRTVSTGDVDSVLAPVKGIITYENGHLSRHP
jgi:hypothetical protein